MLSTGRPSEVILASGSASRRMLLEKAGIAVSVVSPHVDEDEVKAALRAERATAEDTAETLAELKAFRVSRHHPDSLVIGADQMLVCDGTWFDKPQDRNAAWRTLDSLRGRTHHLVTAVVVVHRGRRIWHHVDKASLTMRRFTDTFLERYLDEAGPEILQSVGAYQLEGLGSQLFLKIEGDYFTILGLPLLPLLEFLRIWNVVSS